MQMAGPDIVLFVVGALLFGGATYAIVSSDGGLGGAGSALGVFTVTYAPSLIEVGSEQAPTLRSATADFDVNETNVLRVLVTVECSDTGPQLDVVPFSLQVRVEGPNGLNADAPGGCTSPTIVEVPVAQLPGSTTAPGATEAQARANLAPATNGTANGGWTVTVSGSRSGQQPVGVPVVDPAGTITLSVEVAEPSFAPVQR